MDAKMIKLIAFDVDGVLTDGTIYYGPQGDALKGFSARDGMGISLTRAAGIKTAVITGRRSPMVEKRAADLHVDYIMQNVSVKWQALEEICDTMGITVQEAAYMGDDLNDVEVISRIGFGAAPADACCEAKEAAQFVATCPGGHGALRQWIEHILKRQNQWHTVLSRYFSGKTVVKQ